MFHYLFASVRDDRVRVVNGEGVVLEEQEYSWVFANRLGRDGWHLVGLVNEGVKYHYQMVFMRSVSQE